MSHERPAPNEGFGFTERELLWDRISHRRFETIVKDEQNAIHGVHLDSNDFGEFLFVTASHPSAEGRAALTFFGLGYHEHRDRWLTDDWFWYETTLGPANSTVLDKQEALSEIEKRRAGVVANAAGQVQSERGKLFEMIADLTDDDGALSEIEDLGGLYDEDDD